MYRIIVQILCATTAYHVMHASATNVDFGDFIEKLLNSDKIELLVDRVADRAVEKLKNLQRNDKAKPMPSKTIENHNILRNVEANDEFLTTTKGPKLNGYRLGDPGKIDMQAAKQKYAQFPFEQLSLKYKHFTNNDARENTKGTSERTIPKNYESKSKNEAMETFIRQEKREQKSPETDRFKNEETVPTDFDFSADHTKAKEKKFHLEDPTVRDRVMYPIDDKVELTNTRLDPHNDEHKFKSRLDTKPKTYYGYKHIMPESLNKQFRTNDQTTANVANEVGNQSQDSESGDDKQTVVGQDRDVAEEAPEQENAEGSDDNVVLRREGDQVLAFPKSPDYEEYHQKYEKEIKNKSSRKPIYTF